MAQTVKHLSTMWETWVQTLGQEAPLEKEMAIHSSTIAWKIPWTEEYLRSDQSLSCVIYIYMYIYIHIYIYTYIYIHIYIYI